jgi:hypothetical protein
MCMRVYVDGSPLDTHLCSSAIEFPLHLGLSMSNAHTHRPFPRCMYMYPFARLYRAHARVCAWVWCVYGGVLIDPYRRLHRARVGVVCVCVRARVCVYGVALHACKLRVSIDISGEVLCSCVKM